MLEHLQNSMLTILILFVLENLFHCYLLSRRSVYPEVDYAKCPLASDPFNLVSLRRNFRSLRMEAVCVSFDDLVSFSFDVFIRGERLAFSDSDLPFRLIAIFEHIL